MAAQTTWGYRVVSEVDWEKVKDIFYASLSRPAGELASFLDAACAGNASLRNEVEVLIRSYQSDFLEESLLVSRTKPLLLPGQRISHYRIERMIGRGGMGEVYLADDEHLHRKVALKLLTVSLSHGNAAARFRREARLASRINHPSVAQVYEFGEDHGRYFIAIEYVNGNTLREIIAAGPLEIGRTMDILHSTLSALKAAHDAGIVHRDIKPENIVVTDGLVKVLDFGLAKMLPVAEAQSARYGAGDNSRCVAGN